MASVGTPEVYMWGSDVLTLVHMRDEKYLPLHSDNRNFLRRRKERKKGKEGKSQKEKTKETGGRGQESVEGKQEKRLEHLSVQCRTLWFASRLVRRLQVGIRARGGGRGVVNVI